MTKLTKNELVALNSKLSAELRDAHVTIGDLQLAHHLDEVYIAELRASLVAAQAARPAPHTSYMIPREVVLAYFAANPTAARSAKPEVIRAWAAANC